ncbi:hypothetical protein QQS21_006468 [Conoideocrella luteorostrata]|uniref:FAD-binding domain-containing protein n=1 Tax=Conoideocrella luteorostrata TaxID=1105319 RepID=A0AAJ0CMJ7_9HYPO|nr:hypothetical protein QQS21_006468 [Conoideocrella luteorostrata]
MVFSERLSAPSTGSPNLSGTRPFRVIIVGAGVGGLVMSHALTRAKIDHVVLEKGVVAPQWGASISIWANGARILQQLGCWEAIRAACQPLQMLYVRDASGISYSAEPYFDMMTEMNGFEYVTLERRKFLKILQEQHPDPQKIWEGKKVIEVLDTGTNILAKLDDGTVEEGDMLIGCDGVHSTVRELMWRNANVAVPNLITTREKTSLETTYRALVGVAKPILGMGTNDMHWITHWGMSFLILTQPNETFFFVNWKLPQKSTWPSKAKWNEAEAEIAAASVAHLPITDSVVTPNLALGAMCAMESSVVLVNKIKNMVDNLGSEQRPSKDSIRDMLLEFQAERMNRQQEASRASAFLTRLHAYDGFLKWLIMRWIIPTVGQARIAHIMGDFCSRAPRISFLPVDYVRKAAYKWQDEPDHVPAQPENSIMRQKGRLLASEILQPASIFAMGLILYVMSATFFKHYVIPTVVIALPKDELLGETSR